MLKQLGRLERTRNVIILGFAILMAVSIYLDVLNLFVALLRIFGLLASNKDEQ